MSRKHKFTETNAFLLLALGYVAIFHPNAKYFRRQSDTKEGSPWLSGDPVILLINRFAEFNRLDLMDIFEENV